MQKVNILVEFKKWGCEKKIINSSNSSSSLHADGNFNYTAWYCQLLVLISNIQAWMWLLSPAGYHGWLMGAYDQVMLYSEKK